ncbi:MAG: FAD-dependent oxidoreductase [Granulosicoccus sp.]
MSVQSHDSLEADITNSMQHGVDLKTDTLIIGAGACGLIAALAARQAGQDVLVVEADAVPSGSTALSAGLIPAAGTKLQEQSGIEDSAAQFAADIQAKALGENAQEIVLALAQGASEVIHWLMDEHGLPFSLVHDFDYPGHSVRRMHGLPSRSGRELIDALRARCEELHVDIICHRRAVDLHHQGLVIEGITVADPNGKQESIACNKLILACNGFGGNRTMVEQYMPQISQGVWFGHDGNQGDAVCWGELMGASIKHLGAYQGHGNVAHPHGILISWAVITQGGIQVNLQGNRFWDESQGYSEAAGAVLSQPGSAAITVFDERIATVARQFEDFKQAETAGAVKVCATLEELANTFSLPVQTLRTSIANIKVGTEDQFGRYFGNQTLSAPYYGVRVTGALFHTQGGLEVDKEGRVMHVNGQSFANLFAGGGAACGVSGKSDSGYLSGNGLLSAVVLGYRAGISSTFQSR